VIVCNVLRSSSELITLWALCARRPPRALRPRPRPERAPRGNQDPDWPAGSSPRRRQRRSPQRARRTIGAGTSGSAARARASGGRGSSGRHRPGRRDRRHADPRARPSHHCAAGGRAGGARRPVLLAGIRIEKQTRQAMLRWYRLPQTSFVKLVELRGVEPLTPRLPALCSPN
jgi:hypothetical protein